MTDLGFCEICEKDTDINILVYGDLRGDLFKGKEVCDICLSKNGATNCSCCGGIFLWENVDGDYECRLCHMKGLKRRDKTCICEKFCNVFTEEEVQKSIPFDPEIISRDTFSVNFRVNLDA